MRDEKTRRRADFRPGIAIGLADGQTWTFPSAWDLGTEDSPDPIHQGPRAWGASAALVRAVLEAEDQDDRLRCELALAIYLLSHNYDLDPYDYQDLLGFEPRSASLARVQEAFHTLAMDHARRLFPRREALAEVIDPPTDGGALGLLRGLLRSGVRLWTGRRPATTMELAGPCR